MELKELKQAVNEAEELLGIELKNEDREVTWDIDRVRMLKLFKSLAETVIALEGKLPKKKDYFLILREESEAVKVWDRCYSEMLSAFAGRVEGLEAEIRGQIITDKIVADYVMKAVRKHLLGEEEK